MQLYIGNATRQIVEFVYRLPETPGARNQSVPIGGQVRVSGDLSRVQIDAIIDQHAKYGLVHVDAIDRTKPFIGLCYSVDRPISSDKLGRAMNHNMEVLTNLGKQFRQEAAVAENNRIEQHIAEEKMPINLKDFEVSIVEESRKDSPAPQFAEGIRVSKGGNDNDGSRGRGRGSQRKRAA